MYFSINDIYVEDFFVLLFNVSIQVPMVAEKSKSSRSIFNPLLQESYEVRDDITWEVEFT